MSDEITPELIDKAIHYAKSLKPKIKPDKNGNYCMYTTRPQFEYMWEWMTGEHKTREEWDEFWEELESKETGSKDGADH